MKLLKKLSQFILLLFFIASNSYSQTITTSQIALEGINFNLSISGLPDSIHSVHVKAANENYSNDYLFVVSKGKVDTSISFNNTGNIKITLPSFS